MSKIIIDNQSENFSDDAVLRYVAHVISKGRISGNGDCYCYATTFKDGISVCAIRNKKSDRFIIIDKKIDVWEN